jgi:chemotaxis protein MotB
MGIFDLHNKYFGLKFEALFLLRMKSKYFLILGLSPFIMFSCVSKKKYTAQLERNQKLEDSIGSVIFKLNLCLDEKISKNKKIDFLESEIERLKKEGGALINQLSDLSVVNKAQAESIKQSLQNINNKEIYIRGLQSAISRKDSLNLALALNLKSSLNDVNDKDIEINVEGSAVFVSISDKLLFETGKYDINSESNNILNKVAKVLNDRPDLRFMVEGHTDSIPINNNRIADNWELSVLRASSVARILIDKYKVNPSRIIVAGRSQYAPVADNSTEEGRSKNRRIRIVIIPELDQFLKLLETKP